MVSCAEGLEVEGVAALHVFWRVFRRAPLNVADDDRSNFIKSQVGHPDSS